MDMIITQIVSSLSQASWAFDGILSRVLLDCSLLVPSVGNLENKRKEEERIKDKGKSIKIIIEG
jgi:hypothetical protein